MVSLNPIPLGLGFKVSGLCFDKCLELSPVLVGIMISKDPLNVIGLLS